jgi:CRISPR/Cas system-associated exonuclease Cas4 (RecB family)
VARLENRLTWSKSRAEVFSHCLRKYWWTYYGSWGGWSSDAAPEARAAYMLKSLHSRWTWVGDVVHRTIERILTRLKRASVPNPGLDLEGPSTLAIDPAAEVARVTDSMRAQYRESREGRYRADPKRAFGLVEHEYGVPVADSEWKEMNRRAVSAVDGFLRSETFREIAASDPSGWLPFEELDSFDFEGTSIWAALDFIRKTPAGADVFDWKTGEERIEGNELQLLVYAMYVERKHGIPATSVTNRLVFVNTGRVHEVKTTIESLEAARQKIRASIAEMKERMRMGGGSEPSALAFPMTDDRDKCSICAFRRLCER